MPSAEETFMMKAIAAAAATVYLAHWFWKWLQRLPVTPDPWETEVQSGEIDAATPVCLNCLTPVAPHQHYCPVCNNVTGEYTRYLPFVNIPFNYSIFATLWRKLLLPDTSWTFRLVAYALILSCAPVMLVVGLPWWLFGKRKKAEADGAKPAAAAAEPPRA